jgi:hypothetical protein
VSHHEIDKKPKYHRNGGSKPPQCAARVLFCRPGNSPAVPAAGSRLAVVVARGEVTSQTCQYMFVPCLGGDSGLAQGYNLLLHG